MQSYLISKDLDNLLFLDVINEDFREQSKLISILISSLTQQSSLLMIYEEKKKLLLDNLNSQRLNENYIFRDKFKCLDFLVVWNLENFKVILYFKNCQKLNERINGIDFASYIVYAKKSMTKVMNHRIEKLSTLLDSNETQLNVTNRIGISIVL